MSSTALSRFPRAFHFSFILFLLTILLVIFHTKCLEDVEILKALRPLKYSSKGCKQFCEKITCQPIKACNDGVIMKNESYCKCCDACVKILDIGVACKKQIYGSLALGSQERCKLGSICNNGICELNTKEDSCLRHRDIREKNMETGKYAKAIWIPQCDKEGNYEAKQNKIEKSFCFDKSGNTIFGNEKDSFENNCACSRYVIEKEEKDPVAYNLKPHEHCSPSGSFDTLQCISNLCYCADPNTGELRSELVNLDFLDKLPCYNNKSHSKSYLKDCEIQLQRSKQLAHDFLKKGVKIGDIDQVKCDPDGTFSPTQCLSDRCVCTNKQGVSIQQYQEVKHPEINMKCNCARDEDSALYMTLSCETNGSYKSISCLKNNKCVCVEEDGEAISQELEKSEASSCEKMIRDLSDYPNEDTSSSDSDYSYDMK